MTGVDDGESSLGWDIETDFDPHRTGWAEKVKTNIPHIEEDEMFLLNQNFWRPILLLVLVECGLS